MGPFPHDFRRFLHLMTFSLLLVLLVACGALRETAVTSPTEPLPATFTPLPSPTIPLQPTAVSEASTPEASETEIGDAADEAILILQPGPGSRIVNSPLHIEGVADPTFEQNLVIRLLLADGTELAVTPTTIQAELGDRGSFAVDMPFTISGEQQAFVQVFATSARDGGVTHLSSVGLTLADSGEEQIVPIEPHPESIQISRPAPGETIIGGTAAVSGVALASFEQTLTVEILDEAGQVLTSQPVIVDAPDLGQPGSFSIDLPYEVASTMAGRIMVHDISPAFGGDAHLASVEVTLAP